MLKPQPQVTLVVRLRHSLPDASRFRANVGVIRTTSNYMILVELMNLTFEHELGLGRDSNVKFAPLGSVLFDDVAAAAYLPA